MWVTLNDTRYEVPTCWEEIKTRQYQALIKANWFSQPLAERDFFMLFSILTDSAYSELHRTTENEVTLWNTIRWFIEQPFEFSEDVPKVLKIGDNIIDVPANLHLLSIGQNIHLRQIIEKTASFDESLSIAVAIYLQPLYTGNSFDFEKAKLLESVIAEMPVYLIRPLGFFLFQSASGYGRTRGRSWQAILHSLKERLKRVLQNLRRFKGSSRLMTFQP